MTQDEWVAYVRGYRMGESSGRFMRWAYRIGIVALAVLAVWRP